jgi:3-phosphoshikimate 1-carboxyvinyltransferase
MKIIAKRNGPLIGTVKIPGDKSISHRALMLSALFRGAHKIYGLLEGEDVLNTAKALRAMGVTIHQRKDGWEVHGVGITGLQEPDDILDMGNSGTGVRLMMGLVSSYPFRVMFTGDASLRGRPMQRVITPLEQAGATFEGRSKGRLPIMVKGIDAPSPINYELPVASAQVKSAVMLAGLNIDGVTEVIEPTLTRDHTERMLRFFGIEVQETPENNGKHIRLSGKPTVEAQDREIHVPVDPSSAAFLVVAALLIEGSELTLPNVCTNPLRIGLFDTLLEMGADIRFENEREEGGEPVADLVVKYSKLTGIEVPASRAPSMIDEYPILAAAAACASGKTIMRGLDELRVKESDRLEAVRAGLDVNGVNVSIEGDDLIVDGNGEAPKGGGEVKTHMDHRIAMSFLVMGMISEEPITVDDGAAINTSFPGFIDLCNSLGAQLVEKKQRHASEYILNVPQVIAIDGPAASGKGTLARKLAEYFQYHYLDTGSLYRAVGWKVLNEHKDPHDEILAVDAAKAIGDRDLYAPELRQERVGEAASVISSYPSVRRILLEFQRQYAAKAPGAILDGRDVGTVVCPSADLKLFVTADVEVRAQRRHSELQEQGVEVVYDSVLENLKKRDERDQSRDVAPLTPADDAIYIDTSTMSANDVFKKTLSIIYTESQ